MQSTAGKSNGIIIKKFGHNRRPSFGKTLPISTILSNYTQSSSNELKYNSIGRDGLSSPELDRPPLIFSIYEDDTDVDDMMTKQSCNENSITHQSVVNQKFTNVKNIKTDNYGLTTKKKTIIDIEDLPIFNLSNSNINSLSLSPSTAADMKNDNNSIKPNVCQLLCENKNNCSKMFNNKNDLLRIIDTNDDINKNCDNNDKLPIDNEMNNNNNNNNNNDKNLLGIAEALVNTSMRTSPAARRRLIARKMEFELNSMDKNRNTTIDNTYIDEFNNSKHYVGDDDDDVDDIPSKEVLIQLVRMGSFNSAPKINNCDTQDDKVKIPKDLSTNDLIHHCKLMRGEERPPLLARYFLKSNLISNDLTSGLRVLQLNSVSKVCSSPISSPKHIRVLQWNILSQSLGQSNDGFVCCPDEALTWECRKYLIIQEIIQNDPDVVCLQEVDHYKFLQCILGTQNYEGIFFPKPDSPCLYINENNGPDGCAIFYKKNKFELLNYDTRILRVWKVQSNQVAIAANFKILENGNEFSVCTTHLKARKGPLLAKLRNEQGKDLLRFVQQISENRPLILCGDFNAEPTEPIYSTILGYNEMGLSSAYADMFAVVNGTENVKTSPLSNNNTASTASSSSQNISNNNNINNNDECDETDFKSNITPDEDEIQTNRIQRLASQEPPFTTWKIREDGEVCHTIDYVFYTDDKLKVNNCLLFPNDIEIGQYRTPSFQYPSDHFSLVCDFELI